jgi:hypothetical protein
MKPESTDYLDTTHRAVRGFMQASTDLPTFLASAGTLSLAQRRRIVDQALVLLEHNYAHLPLKEAMHAANPVQALRLLKDRLADATNSTVGSEFEFHAEMLRIFLSVRDLHTNYVLPKPFADQVAFVPFDIEQYVDGTPRYLVSHIVPGFTHPSFTEGVEVRAWNGIPIHRAVEVIANRHGGSNRAARHARGVQLLTQRPLMRHLPPDEAWVEVDYVTADGDEHSIRFEWRVFDITGAVGAINVDKPSAEAAAMGVDAEVGALTTAKRLLFAPGAEAAGRRKARVTTRAASAGEELATTMSGIVRARSVVTSTGEVGHLRIFTFSVADPGAFVAEVRRLVALLPQDRLIIDVRGNGGGHIWASEGLLQLFTPRRITPEPTQFIATSLNRRICHRHRDNPVGIDLEPWLPSLALSVRTGAVFSTGHPITPYDFANTIGQTYRGRVACITDALCYSATDIFAAGFQDHGIGPVVGVDDNTGAGGANVWTHELLRQLMRVPNVDAESPYERLPQGVGMRVSIRRTLRVGERSGTPLEDLGVRPDKRIDLTRDDLVHSNRDLLDGVASILQARPLRRLEANVAGTADGLTTIDLDTDEIGRIDVYIDGRPFGSFNVRRGPNQVAVPDTAHRVRFEGFSGDDLVISNNLDLRS